MFWNIFLKLCSDNDKKPTAVATELKISRGSVTSWKNGAKPLDVTLKKIADYFGVSVEYLKGEEESRGEEPKQHLVPLDQQNVYMVPLFESVSAGFGAYASNNVEDYMPVYFSNPTEANGTICIRVRGDSMYPKIENGDIIQVHKQDSVDPGAIAVVLVDGDDGLVKKVQYGPGWIELISINPMYQPMRFEGSETERVCVVGLVTQVIKCINGRKIDSIKASDNKKELLVNIGKMSADELKEFNAIYNEYMRSKQTN